MHKSLPAIGLLLCLVSPGLLPAAEGVPTREQLTNKLRFKIPFQFDSKDLARRDAREVQLHESRDEGKRWTLAQSVDPAAERFQFQAPGSGVYWFSLRMIDGQGRAYPDGQLKPGLKVRVDADRPQIQLDLTQSSPGTIQVAWDVQDELLDLESLKLRIKLPGSRNWSEPEIEHHSRDRYDFKITQPGAVTVELTASDLAGNSETETKSLQASGPNETPPPRRGEKIARGRDGDAADPLTMSSAFPGASRRTAPRETDSDPASATASTGRGRLPAQFASQQAETRSDRNVPPSRRVQSAVQIVNTLRFQLRYALIDVEPEDLESVDLYLTGDGGATWNLHVSDDDLRSPILVQVDEPGEYGLNLVVKDRNGAGGTPPEDGTVPSMSIIVDQRAPELELISVVPERNGRQKIVTITWRASDEHLSEQPIALYHAEKLSGPWVRIAGKLPNSGTYEWAPAIQLPDLVFVRIEARDAAGNMRSVETPRGVPLDSPRAAKQPELGGVK